MDKYKSLQNLLLVTLTFAVLFLTSFCNQDYVPESSLEMRDTLIYKKGSNIPFTGREKARVRNKVIEYNVFEGVRHGEFIIYYENGNIEIKGQMDNGRNLGKWQYYYQSGEIESEGYFVNNQPEGKWIWYSLLGNIKEEGNYKQGRRVGLWKNFDDDGNVIQEKEFSFDDTTSSNEIFFDKFNKDNE